MAMLLVRTGTPETGQLLSQATNELLNQPVLNQTIMASLNEPPGGALIDSLNLSLSEPYARPCRRMLWANISMKQTTNLSLVHSIKHAERHAVRVSVNLWCRQLWGGNQFGVAGNSVGQPIRVVSKFLVLANFGCRPFAVSAKLGYQQIRGVSKFRVSANSGCQPSRVVR